jgi:hypothetical protein
MEIAAMGTESKQINIGIPTGRLPPSGRRMHKPKLAKQKIFTWIILAHSGSRTQRAMRKKPLKRVAFNPPHILRP